MKGWSPLPVKNIRGPQKEGGKGNHGKATCPLEKDIMRGGVLKRNREKSNPKIGKSGCWRAGGIFRLGGEKKITKKNRWLY